MSSVDNNTDFFLRLARSLHRYGTPAHRLELALQNMSAVLGLQTEIMSTPTSIMVGFGPPEAQRTTLLRVEPGNHNLEKLARVDDLAERVAAESTSVEIALSELDHIETSENKIPPSLYTIAFPLVSASSACLLGGGYADIAVAAFSGLLVGLLSLVAPRTTAGGRLFELVAAFLVGSVAHITSTFDWGISYQSLMLAGLIVLVPGLTLTIAITELATRNLVSGTARLTAAAVVFLQIIFGIALSEKLLAHLIGSPQFSPHSPLPILSQWIALLVACLGVSALFRALPRDILIISLTTICAYVATRQGSLYLSPELGACAGGFVAAAIANGYARIKNRSAMVALVPGLLLLVPGSLGFRSMNSFWAHDVVGGMEAAFKMVLVAIALVAGILVANAVVLPRRSL